MTVHRLSGPPGPALARALAEFEAAFRYPLGPGRSFGIRHGDDYPRFFRAMGEAACFVAEEEGRVVGAVGVAVRRLLLPDGTERPAAYVGDLKVSPNARNGFTFLRLAWEAQSWVRGRAEVGFGVVMDGTPVTPDAYMGRAGLPDAAVLGKVMVFRLACPKGPLDPGDADHDADEARGAACYRALSRGRYASPGGDPAERSEARPAWLVHPGGLACGRLEDTRRAKRLFDDAGEEMVSGHLAAFACRTPAAGAGLVRVALRRARAAGLPALFVAVAAADAAGLREALGTADVVEAPATVYGVGLGACPDWNVNSSEI
jgi:hypothetical protein